MFAVYVAHYGKVRETGKHEKAIDSGFEAVALPLQNLGQSTSSYNSTATRAMDKLALDGTEKSSSQSVPAMSAKNKKKAKGKKTSNSKGMQLVAG